jgi:hypothetical protein
MPLEGEFGNLCHRSIGRMPSDRKLAYPRRKPCDPDVCPPLRSIQTASLHTGQTGVPHQSDRYHRSDRFGAAAPPSSVLRSRLCGSTKEPSGFLVNHQKPLELSVASANRHS